MNYPATDQQNLKLIVTLTRCLHSIHQKEAPVIQEAGITMPQFSVLELLYHKGPQKICTIIEKTLSSGGNMTVVIDNLVKQGLVSRVEDPTDRRSRLVSLTPGGKSLIKGLFIRHRKNLAETLGHLTAREKEQLIKLTRKLGLAIVTRRQD